MIERAGDKLQVSGDVTMATVSALFKEGLNLSRNGKAASTLVVDFAQLGTVDSSAVSLMLAWLREAQRSNTQLKFANVPENLISLANLYGVAELLNLNAS